MGNFSSKKRTPQEERQLQLSKSGVLVPPSFGVGTNSAVLPPSSPAALLQHPSCFEKILAELPCKRLLEEHTTPGVWVSATTTSNGSVLASWIPGDNYTYEGMLCASQQIMGDSGKIDLRAHNVAPSSVSAYYNVTPNCIVNGTMQTSGHGWVGCHVNTNIKQNANIDTQQQEEYYRNDPFLKDESPTKDNNKTLVKLASWVQFQSLQNMTNAETLLQSVTGFGTLQTKGYTAAVQATVPLKSWREPQLSYLASFDLNSQGPPLTVTLQQTPQVASMSLSQIITFDRYVTNLLEERCPKIRNTLGWSVQMKRDVDSNKSNLSAGAAWQINRGLALKMLASPESGLTAGILLKRWKEPRVTCSFLFGTKCMGIGVEFETGPPTWQSSKEDDLYYSGDGRAQVSSDTPATKATLPTEEK